MKSRDGFPFEIWRVHLLPIHLSLLWSAEGMSQAVAEQPWFTMLGTRAVRDQHSFCTSVRAQSVLCDCLGEGCSRLSRSGESAHLGQGTVPHSREPCLAARAQCPRRPLFLWFASVIERQFLWLSCTVMPLSWDWCCQEKMVLPLKQRWHCAT